MQKSDFIKKTDWLWEIPRSFRPYMRVPARIYVSEEMLDQALQDKTMEQLISATSFPGIVNYAIAMPDAHQGYGVPIGFVGAINTKEGIISPSAVGFDINCGIRLLKSQYKKEEILPYLDRIATRMQAEIPSGLGKGRKIKLKISDIDKILKKGVPVLVEQGFGEESDIGNCESKGQLQEADPRCVSQRAKERGRGQVGTLGSGNHFAEIQMVEKIFDKEVAKIFGLFEEQVVIMIHTGSRGLGHQTCSDYLKIATAVMPRYNIKLPDRELACLPFQSPEGQRYFRAMSAAANYAWANRHMISHHTRKVWETILGKESKLDLLYDVAHNMAKIEKHDFDGKQTELLIHRKGATRAFPPNHSEIPEEYKTVGQPVLIPGTMGTASYVLAGIEESKESWHTVCHGAGRTMSRKSAIRNFPGQRVVEDLKNKGITVRYKNFRGIAEEAPGAYKDVDKVVEVVENAHLATKVARLIPLAVIKGE